MTLFSGVRFPTNGEEPGIPVAVTCRVLNFSRQGYYRWKNQSGDGWGLGGYAPDDAAFDIHADDLAFGYRFIADDLPERAFRQARTGSDGAGDGKDGWGNSRSSNRNQSTGPRSQRPKPRVNKSRGSPLS